MTTSAKVPRTLTVLAAVLVVLLGVGAIACRRASPPAPGLESVADSEGLAIDADGTVYFSQPSAVGRLTPAGKLDKEWAKLPGATKTWGIAIDRPAKALYIGSPATTTVYKVTLDDAPTVTTFVANAGAPNGLTMGPEGALYYTDFQAAGDVYRVAADGTRTKVTASTLPRPNGLAFGPDGALYVDLFEQGAVTRLTLAGGKETARADFITSGLDKADGIAFDNAGNVYIGWGEGVSRAAPDGKSLTKLAKGRTANAEFGAGAIPTTDLYAVTEKKLVRITNDLPGAAVRWHAP
jgi:sugar lactone lactonase YvrE